MRPQEMVERAVELLGHARGTVLVESSTTANLRWANSTLTTNGMAQSHSVHVVAHPALPGGPGAGSASGVVHTSADLAALVDRALRAAVESGPAEDAADEVPPRAASADWDLPPQETSPASLAPVSDLLGEVLPDRSVEHFGYAEHDMTTTHLGTTGGLRLRHDQPTARFELCGKTAGRTRSAWAGRAGRHFAEMDLASAPGEVGRGLAAQANHIEVPAGRHRVVLSSSAVADLLIYLLWSAGLRDARDGRSALSRPGGGTRLGERLADLPVTLASDPRAQGLECADHVRTTRSSAMSSAFDAGLPLEPTEWIADGRLQALVGTRRLAAEAGVALTPMVDNLIAGVDGAHGTLDGLASRVGDGLLVTCLWYIREVDAQSLLVTGLTRDGVYVVRDGAIVGAAGNFRFNESPLGMLHRILDAGSPAQCLPREWADWFTRTRVAPLAIDEFNLSTASEAV
jgi:predicted Zn-dependent protease